MKIQEMRSGISHLTKRMEMKRWEDLIELPPPETCAAPQVQPEVLKSESCDLDQPRWSVVSFDEVDAGGLTYRQAARLMNELEMNDVPGLCIVTDEAAKRLGR